MLTLREGQIVHLAAAAQERFSRRLTKHLVEVSAVLDPDQEVDFTSTEFQRWLREQMDYLINYGISDEASVASVIELFALLGVEPESPSTRRIIEQSQASASEKIEQLSMLQNVNTSY
jgi:hypothetical protein